MGVEFVVEIGGEGFGGGDVVAEGADAGFYVGAEGLIHVGNPCCDPFLFYRGGAEVAESSSIWRSSLGYHESAGVVSFVTVV